MAKAKKRALPRRERNYPQTHRVFSTNFLDLIVSSDNKCFVPLSDYQKLENKYLRLYKRYRRK